MQIFLRTLTGEELTLEVAHDDTIQTVKAKIHNKADIPACQVWCLIFAGANLIDRLCVSDYGTQRGNTLHLVLCHQIKPELCNNTYCQGNAQVQTKLCRNTYFVKPAVGKTIVLKCFPGDTIGLVKERIQDKEGVPADQLRLVFAGQQLANDQTLIDYDIDEGSTMFLVLRANMVQPTNAPQQHGSVRRKIPSREYCVKTLTGKSITLECPNSDTIALTAILTPLSPLYLLLASSQWPCIQKMQAHDTFIKMVTFIVIVPCLNPSM